MNYVDIFDLYQHSSEGHFGKKAMAKIPPGGVWGGILGTLFVAFIANTT